jgi:hypothetical protein
MKATESPESGWSVEDAPGCSLVNILGLYIDIGLNSRGRGA